jgi:hypothetical protein
MSESTQTVDLDSIFTDDELIVLCDYLGESRPDHLDPDLFPEEVVEDPSFDSDYWETSSALDRLGFTEERHSMCEWFEREEAATASILLESVQRRLPQWGYYDGEKIVLGRERCRPPRKRGARVALFPQLLFAVSWDSTSPAGADWPYAFHLTWLPFFRQYVVTASGSSIDLVGYCDMAIGHFPDSLEGPALIDRVLSAVSTYLGYFENTGCWHPPTEVTECGLVSLREARRVCGCRRRRRSS